MKRVVIFGYGVVSYAAFFLTFLYAIGFVGNIFVPKTIDGEPTLPFWQALAVNAVLLTIFAVQHSVMARPAFKKWWTQYVPQPAERSTYVLASSVALIALFVFWQPMGITIWNVEHPAAQTVLYTLFGTGWLIVLVTTFMINHFDLFGLRQVWLYLLGREYTSLKFHTPGAYAYVRHPLYVGWLMAFWFTPVMTAAHLVFAIATTAYILIAIQLEEKDLQDHFGQQYIDYKENVPMLVPRVKGKYTPATPSTPASA